MKLQPCQGCVTTERARMNFESIANQQSISYTRQLLCVRCFSVIFSNNQVLHPRTEISQNGEKTQIFNTSPTFYRQLAYSVYHYHKTIKTNNVEMDQRLVMSL